MSSRRMKVRLPTATGLPTRCQRMREKWPLPASSGTGPDALHDALYPFAKDFLDVTGEREGERSFGLGCFHHCPCQDV